MRDLPTELLRSFVSVVDTGSFTRTSEIVSRTQPAVSLQIRRLEEMVEQKLLVRNAQNLGLTAEGRLLLQYARRILALNDEVQNRLKQPDVEGRIRLGAPHEYTASLMPEILGKFAQSHPNVTLEVTSELSKNLLKRYIAKEFDLVLSLHDEPGFSDGHEILQEALVWVASADHNIHEEEPLPLVLAPAPCIYRARILRRLNDINRPCRIRYLSSSYADISAAVLSGIGVTAMAKSTAPRGARILDGKSGFPSLGKLSLKLHRNTESHSEALLRLKNYVIASFSKVVSASSSDIHF